AGALSACPRGGGGSGGGSGIAAECGTVSGAGGDTQGGCGISAAGSAVSAGAGGGHFCGCAAGGGGSAGGAVGGGAGGSGVLGVAGGGGRVGAAGVREAGAEPGHWVGGGLHHLHFGLDRDAQGSGRAARGDHSCGAEQWFCTAGGRGSDGICL